MKYISMKMLPKGSKPPTSDITGAVRYHLFWGMGEGIRFTLHGLSGHPFQFLPTTVPKRHRGIEINNQMSNTTTMEPNGTAAKEWYVIAIVLSTKAMPKKSIGNNVAVMIMVRIQLLPSWRA